MNWLNIFELSFSHRCRLHSSTHNYDPVRHFWRRQPCFDIFWSHLKGLVWIHNKACMSSKSINVAPVFLEHKIYHICMYVTGCPYPTTIERVPTGFDGMEPGLDLGERVQDPIFPTQWTDGVSTHKRSQVTALGRITRELCSAQLRGIPILYVEKRESPRPQNTSYFPQF